MGWTSGHYSRRSMVAHLLNDQSTETCKFETLGRKFIGNNLWARMRRTHVETGEVVTFIVLFMLRRYGKEDWGYKDVEESMGPNLVNCPLSFLGGLSPPTNEYSAQWRQRVREHHARIGTGRKKALRVGDFVALRGCKVPYVKIESLRPLTGSHPQGGLYAIPRERLDFNVNVHDLLLMERQVLELAEYVTGWVCEVLGGGSTLSAAVVEAAKEELKGLPIQTRLRSDLEKVLDGAKASSTAGHVAIDAEAARVLDPGALQTLRTAIDDFRPAAPVATTDLFSGVGV